MSSAYLVYLLIIAYQRGPERPHKGTTHTHTYTSGTHTDMHTFRVIQLFCVLFSMCNKSDNKITSQRQYTASSRLITAPSLLLQCLLLLMLSSISNCWHWLALAHSYGNYSVFASVAPPVDFDRARAPRLPLVAGSGGKRGGVGKPRGRLLEKSKESSAKVVAYQWWAVSRAVHTYKHTYILIAYNIQMYICELHKMSFTFYAHFTSHLHAPLKGFWHITLWLN